MKFLPLIFAFFFLANFNANAQESTDLRSLALGNIEFTLYPNPEESQFKVQFLLPRDQVMEMYLIDQSGDKVGSIMQKQYIISGVKTYDFDFPEDALEGTYFLVIKSNKNSIIKKVDYTRKQ